MRETTFYERLLGIERPWRVHDVRLALEQGDVEVGVEFVGETLVYPTCGAACPGYDRWPRTWRHLDTMQYRTLVRAEVPRVRCSEHGVQQVPVPWADAQARFTALFEAMVIDWLKVASFAAVARQCRLSWDQVAGIQARAVRRGRSRRAVAAAPLVGVDETSFQRRHEYVTVVNDLTALEPRVLYVADRRDRAVSRRLLRRGARGRLRADRDGGDGHVARLHRVGARPHRGAHRLRHVPHRTAPERGGRPGPAVGESGRCGNWATTCWRRHATSG